jgi:hypothetical protein
VTDADVSVGLRRFVMKLTIFPDLLKTVKTTEEAPFAPAFGENLMSPVSEFGPVFMTGFVSVAEEEGSPPAFKPEIEDVEDIESMVMLMGAEGEELLPAGSAIVAVTDQSPALSAGKSHCVATPTM